ncbi:MAG: hypothetical protein ACRCZS_29975 [Chroococcidiopsis sp.]
MLNFASATDLTAWLQQPRK